MKTSEFYQRAFQDAAFRRIKLKDSCYLKRISAGLFWFCLGIGVACSLYTGFREGNWDTGWGLLVGAVLSACTYTVCTNRIAALEVFAAAPNQSSESAPGPTESPRPRANWTQIISAGCAALTAFAAICGVYSYFGSIKTAKLRSAEESIARLYPLDINVNQTLGQYPRARAALYEDPNGTIFKGLTEQENAVFRDSCDALGEVFEYYLLIRDDIVHHPKGRDIVQSWNEYERVTCQQSYGFRAHINSQRRIWTQMFLEEFDRYTQDLPPPRVDKRS